MHAHIPRHTGSVDMFDEEDKYKDAWCRADGDGCWLSGINCKSSMFADCCYGAGFLPRGCAQLVDGIYWEGGCNKNPPVNVEAYGRFAPESG